MSDTERIEVVYFFYYGCQWCYQFEPFVDDWLKKKPVDVSFRRVPALRNTKWVALTRAYYAFEALDLLPRLHAKAFRAFHKEDVNLQSEGTLFDWVAKQGINRDRFEEVFHSDSRHGAHDGLHAHSPIRFRGGQHAERCRVDGRYHNQQRNDRRRRPVDERDRTTDPDGARRSGAASRWPCGW